MTAFLELFIAELKLNFRNKQAIFWRLVFPLMFITIFGLFNLDQPSSTKIFVIDEANNPMSQGIIKGFEKISFFQLEKSNKIADLVSAKDRLKQDKINFILVLPQELKNLSASLPQLQPISLKVYYNEANVMTNQIALNALDQITAKLNAQAANAPQLFSLDKQALTNKKIRYIDFLVPGIVAMSIMQSAIIGMAVYLTEYREKKVLKRVLATPVSPKTFVAALVLSRLVLSILQIIIILVSAKLLFNVAVFGSYLDVGIITILGSVVFLNIGFIISSFSKTTAAAEGLSQVITMPMMFLSGVFFSTETLPSVVRVAVDKLPLAPTINALRSVILNGEGIVGVRNDLLMVLAWVLATSLIAVWRLRGIKD